MCKECAKLLADLCELVNQFFNHSGLTINDRYQVVSALKAQYEKEVTPEIKASVKMVNNLYNIIENDTKVTLTK